MEEHSDSNHPQDAYELGRTAVAKLKEHDQELSMSLPNAIQILFSDSEFRKAIVNSGVVTDQRQALTPVASYQVITTPGALSVSPLPSRSTRSRTREISGSIHVEKVVEVEASEEDDSDGPTSGKRTRGRGRRGPRKSVSASPPKKTPRLALVRCDGSSGTEPCAAAGPSSATAIQDNLRSGYDQESETCVCCNSASISIPISDSNEDNAMSNKRLLRDMFWLAIGMEKVYDRRSNTFPFCEKCSSKIQKMLDISKHMVRLQDEFNDIRDQLVIDLINKHARLTVAYAKNGENVRDVVLKVRNRMKKQFLEIQPGKKLLDDLDALNPDPSDQVVNNGTGTTESGDNDGDEIIDMRPFECRVCDKRFVSDGARIGHESSHKVSPFQCDACGKSYPNRKGLYHHTKICQPSSSFKCSYCDKIFRASANLKDHERRHLRFKPYECSICSERFYVMKVFRNHFEKKHPGLKIQEYVIKHNPPSNKEGST